MAAVTDLGVELRCPVQGPSERRCQLLVGHEAGHAAMVLGGHVRAIATWNSAPGASEEPADVACRYPWAPGFPTVAEDILAIST